ncbi:hypothetical protein M5C97_04755 [Acidovorax sp. NCPPB 3859]|nr:MULTISPECIES: hypothetical protein [unclassified Acidovorax]MDA8448528.1 hypothetical protein [Acidovorax sp. GBBC 3297]MDA8458353.1 hypothetical protein [Acidovorax sp. GBBC 3333]MDA8463391.1 hypothetical protein [Acidovorax sp. GBBC 3332]MDA8468004.1 hypothetical protein [Acidovorax sp. GBBC 3299]WCM79616.1 hypothetical protein M5C94_04750 [Acidovorax sp. GBBC 712]
MRHTITRVSRTLRGALALAGALAAIPGLAAPQSGDPAFTRPDPVRLPDRPMLRAFLEELGQTRRANTFCFVQQRLSPPETAEDGTSVLSMLWHEGARVYLVNLVRPGQRYQPVEDSVGEGRALASSSGSVDLKTDVVPTDADVGSSTTLVSRAWVERLKAQCRRVGTTIRVPAFTPRRTP